MGAMRREVTETMKKDLIKEIQQVFQRFRAAITQPGNDGQPEVSCSVKHSLFPVLKFTRHLFTAFYFHHVHKRPGFMPY